MERSLYRGKIGLKTETKWIWFKRFIKIMGLAAGGLSGLAVVQKDLALLIASFSLGVGAASLSALAGFVDALSKDFENLLEKIGVKL